jgi:pectate lyase
MVGFNGTEGIAEFIDCTITGNTSDNSSYAGGLTIGQFSSVTLTNCTVSGNKISTKEWPSETITLSPMNINVWSSGQLFHTGLILPEGGSTVSGNGIISPHIP